MMGIRAFLSCGRFILRRIRNWRFCGFGSVMAKPVAGDIDGDGHLDIFLASQDVSPGGYYDEQGLWNAPNGYDGTIVRIRLSG